MNRGSECDSRLRVRAHDSFNEAPIHESGKSAPSGFTTLNAVEASMRPRFMNRGSVFAGLGTAVLRNGFNEAPIHESGKLGLQLGLENRNLELQ